MTTVNTAIQVGHYTRFELFGLTFNLETMIAATISAALVVALAFYARAKMTSVAAPSGPQLFFEAVTVQMRQQIEGAMGMRIGGFVLPVAVTLFTFILFSNWLSILPLVIGEHELLKPPAADVNFAYALAISVFVWYHLAGFRRRGLIGHPARIAKGHLAALAPINIVEEFTKPISLSLRLFGNVFAGSLMVGLITMFPFYVMWAPNAIWKMFELFVGFIQALIFSLLTVIYFSQAMDMSDDH